MNEREFREALTEMDPDDRPTLVVTVQERVRTLSRRHLEIGERIQDSDQTRKGLAQRLEEAERLIVEQADEAVEQDVDSIEDVEALPEDAAVEFDPGLLAEIEAIREEARSNYRVTADEGAALQAELRRNSRELRRHQEVLSEMEEDELPPEQARAQLLAFFDETETS